MSRNALQHFRGENKFNCAQAILKTFSDLAELGDECIQRFKAMGGGKADGGLCGALYAARHLASSDEQADIIEQQFVEAAGARTCREIRKLNQLKCAGCVETAAKLLEDSQDGGPLRKPPVCSQANEESSG